jgi:hypothetical protein
VELKFVHEVPRTAGGKRRFVVSLVEHGPRGGAEV